MATTPRAPLRSRTSPFAECTEPGTRRARTTVRPSSTARESPRALPFIFTPPRAMFEPCIPRRSCNTVATFAESFPSPADAGAATFARISVRLPPFTPEDARKPAPSPSAPRDNHAPSSPTRTLNPRPAFPLHRRVRELLPNVHVDARAWAVAPRPARPRPPDDLARNHRKRRARALRDAPSRDGDAVERWFIDALRGAKNGDPNQAALLAEMLMVGYGCERDVEEARYWKQVARNGGARRIEGVYDELP